MSSHAEDVLYASLTDTESLETLVEIGLEPEAIPTELMRPVVEWAINQFFESGRTKAPTREALLETWADQIEAARVDLIEGAEETDTDTIQWAIRSLKSHYIYWQFQQFVTSSSQAMAAAQIEERLPLLDFLSGELFTLSSQMQPRHMRIDAPEGLRRALHNYESRARDGHRRRGVAFGLQEVDDHTYNIHPGELCIIAAPPKVGKSFLLARIALDAWINQGKRVALFTLENSVEMTFDRIVCMRLGIRYRDWQRGECIPEQVQMVHDFYDRVGELPGHLEVIQPDSENRTMAAMVRRAQLMDADALLIDQLTFVRHPKPGNKSKPAVIGELMHELKELISTGPQPIATIMAHQINREGVAFARKAERMEMDHLAEGSEVERTADWVFGLHQGAEQRRVGEALLQIMAARREDLKAWEIVWEPARGLMAVIREKVFAE